MGFDFTKLEAYKTAKSFYQDIKTIIREKNPDKYITDQLSRAALSIVLNIAEGYGRFHSRDKRNLYCVLLPQIFQVQNLYLI